MTTSPVFCVNCIHHKFDGLSHWCHHPRYMLQYQDYQTGEMKSYGPGACYRINHDGNCQEYEEHPPSPPTLREELLSFADALKFWEKV